MSPAAPSLPDTPKDSQHAGNNKQNKSTKKKSLAVRVPGKGIDKERPPAVTGEAKIGMRALSMDLSARSTDAAEDSTRTKDGRPASSRSESPDFIIKHPATPKYPKLKLVTGLQLQPSSEFPRLISARAVPPARQSIHPNLVMTPQRENGAKSSFFPEAASGNESGLVDQLELPSGATAVDQDLELVEMVVSTPSSPNRSGLEEGSPLSYPGIAHTPLGSGTSGSPLEVELVQPEVTLSRADEDGADMEIKPALSVREEIPDIRPRGLGQPIYPRLERSRKKDWWRRDPHPMFSPRFASQRLLVEFPFGINVLYAKPILEKHFEKYGALLSVFQYDQNGERCCKGFVVFTDPVSVQRVFHDPNRNVCSMDVDPGATQSTIIIDIRPSASELERTIFIRVTGSRSEDEANERRVKRRLQLDAEHEARDHLPTSQEYRGNSARPKHNHGIRSDGYGFHHMNVLPHKVHLDFVPIHSSRVPGKVFDMVCVRNLTIPWTKLVAQVRERSGRDPRHIRDVTILGEGAAEQDYIPVLCDHLAEVTRIQAPTEDCPGWLVTVSGSRDGRHLMNELQNISGFFVRWAEERDGHAGKVPGAASLYNQAPFAAERSGSINHGSPTVHSESGALPAHPLPLEINTSNLSQAPAYTHLRKALVHTYRGRPLLEVKWSDETRFFDECGVFVGRLNKRLETYGTLYKRFEKYGQIMNMEYNPKAVPIHVKNATARIMYANKEATSRAISAEDGEISHGCCIKVELRRVIPSDVQTKWSYVDDSGRFFSPSSAGESSTLEVPLSSLSISESPSAPVLSSTPFLSDGIYPDPYLHQHWQIPQMHGRQSNEDPLRQQSMFIQHLNQRHAQRMQQAMQRHQMSQGLSLEKQPQNSVPLQISTRSPTATLGPRGLTSTMSTSVGEDFSRSPSYNTMSLPTMHSMWALDPSGSRVSLSSSRAAERSSAHAPPIDSSSSISSGATQNSSVTALHTITSLASEEAEGQRQIETSIEPSPQPATSINLKPLGYKEENGVVRAIYDDTELKAYCEAKKIPYPPPTERPMTSVPQMTEEEVRRAAQDWRESLLPIQTGGHDPATYLPVGSDRGYPRSSSLRRGSEAEAQGVQLSRLRLKRSHSDYSLSAIRGQEDEWNSEEVPHGPSAGKAFMGSEESPSWPGQPLFSHDLLSRNPSPHPQTIGPTPYPKVTTDFPVDQHVPLLGLSAHCFQPEHPVPPYMAYIDQPITYFDDPMRFFSPFSLGHVPLTDYAPSAPQAPAGWRQGPLLYPQGQSHYPPHTHRKAYGEQISTWDGRDKQFGQIIRGGKSGPRGRSKVFRKRHFGAQGGESGGAC